MNEHTHGTGIGLKKMLSEAEYQVDQTQGPECGSLLYLVTYKWRRGPLSQRIGGGLKCGASYRLCLPSA